MPVDIYYIVYGIPIAEDVLETIKKSLISQPTTITEDIIEDEEFQEFNDAKNIHSISDVMEKDLIFNNTVLSRKDFRLLLNKYIIVRPGKTLLRKLENFLAVACNIDDVEFIELNEPLKTFIALYLDKVTSMEELSKFGFVKSSLGVVLYLQDHFVTTKDFDGDEEYLADLHELEMVLRHLDRNGRQISVEDEEFQEFNKKLKELNTDAKNLHALLDRIEDERNLIFEHPALTRKNFRHFLSQYITELKHISKLFLERRRTKDLCISQKDLKIKITNIVNLFRSDDRKNFFSQLNSLAKDYNDYCQGERKIEKGLDNLGITELYQGNIYVGKEIWSTYDIMHSDKPIKFKFKEDGNTVFPISFNISPDKKQDVNNRVEILKKEFPNITFPEVGLYWRYGTS